MSAACHAFSGELWTVPATFSRLFKTVPSQKLIFEHCCTAYIRNRKSKTRCSVKAAKRDAIKTYQLQKRADLNEKASK